MLPACYRTGEVSILGDLCPGMASFQESLCLEGLRPGRSLSGGGSLSSGVSVQGVSVQGVSVWGVSLTEVPPLCTESQTPMKTLPCRNLVAGGNDIKRKSLAFQCIAHKSATKLRTTSQTEFIFYLAEFLASLPEVDSVNLSPH